MSSIFREDLFGDKVAVITGGGTGICRGITEGLAQHGARTVIVSRKAEHLEPAAEAIRSATGQPCLPVVADVRYPDQVESVMAQTLEAFGQIDILINGAAGNFLCPAAALSPNGFGTVLDIDTKGTWHCSRAAFDAWMRDHGGQILSISATLHYGGTPLQLHVSAAKAAIDALTRNLAVEWGPLGIRVNAIAPGGIDDTEGARRLIPPGTREKIIRNVPIGRLGTIDDVVQLTLFVLSDAGSNIHGTVLVTDGGACLVGAFPTAEDLAAFSPADANKS